MYTCEAFRWKRIATENVMFTELLIYIWYSLFSQMRGSGYSLWFGSCTIITKNYSHFLCWTKLSNFLNEIKIWTSVGKFFLNNIKIRVSCRKVLSENLKTLFSGVFCTCHVLILQITRVLRFLYIVSILGKDDFWIRDSGVDWIKLICFNQTQNIHSTR